MPLLSYRSVGEASLALRDMDFLVKKIPVTCAFARSTI